MSAYSEQGPHWRLRKRASSSRSVSTPNPTMVEVHEWVRPTHCHEHDKQLRHGHLLRWMDVAACLSAEKHAKAHCVTVSVDDITFDATVNVGHIVILRAVVNRAFTSSLEVGLMVKSEDPLTGETQDVCNALFVFVARPKDGVKVNLPSVVTVTEEENREHLLAAERRRMRITYAKDLERLLKNLSISENTTASPTVVDERKVRVSETIVQTVQIVLPVHANHHGTTFGGQIMEWMTDVATLSALRLCRSALILEGIESVIFRGPSYVGERLSLKSCVNKVFSTKQLEVGVRVEGYCVGGEKRHINSAFYIFRQKETNHLSPQLIYDTQIEDDRAKCATARHCLWLDRKAIRYDEREVNLTTENAYDLILKNTTNLMTNYAHCHWEVIKSVDSFQYCKYQKTENMILRISDTLPGLSASDVFAKLADIKNRPKWDFMCKHVKEMKCITKDDSILHLVFKAIDHDSGQIPKDFVVLASKRFSQEIKSPHVMAFRSVQMSDLPPLKDYERSRVLSSGYILEDVVSGTEQRSCKITYIHQLGSSTMPFFVKDLLGVSTLMEKLFYSLRAFLFK